MKRFRGLTANQTNVFEQIAVGNDRGHHPATVTSLINKRFVVRLTDRVVGRDVFGPIAVPQYEVPVILHMEWCQWCDENCPDERQDQRPDSTKVTTTPEGKDESVAC